MKWEAAFPSDSYVFPPFVELSTDYFQQSVRGGGLQTMQSRVNEMNVQHVANAVAAGGVPRQRQWHRQGRDAASQQLRRRGSSVAYGGVGILITFWSISYSFAPPQGANRGAHRAVAYIRACAAPIEATVAATVPLAARSRSGRTALGSGAAGGEAAFARSGGHHSVMRPALLGLVHKAAGAAGRAGGSSATLPGDATSAGKREAAAEQVALAAPASKSVLPMTHTRTNGKQMYTQRMEVPAFLEQHAGSGQHAVASAAVECSCEVAGECLPKGSCVAIACVLVAFSVVTVFLLAWLLQWLSAIPSEWILAKRFRRRSLSFFSKEGPTGDIKGDDHLRCLSPAVTGGPQPSQNVKQGSGASPEEPLLEEQQTAAADSVHRETGTPDRYESRTTPLPKPENGRL